MDIIGKTLREAVALRHDASAKCVSIYARLDESEPCVMAANRELSLLLFLESCPEYGAAVIREFNPNDGEYCYRVDLGV